jgi:hypothetical protein
MEMEMGVGAIQIVQAACIRSNLPAAQLPIPTQIHQIPPSDFQVLHLDSLSSPCTV